MKNKLTVLFHRLSRKRLGFVDCVLTVLALFCLFYVLRHSYQYDLTLDSSVALESPWLAKADKAGNYYIVDREKSRILKVTDGRLDGIIHGGAPEGDTFYSADNICIAADGAVYVLETGWSENGFSVSYESIIRYDQSGHPGEICYQADYDSIYCDKHRIFGMESEGEKLYFVSADEAGFSLNELDIHTLRHQILSTYEMADAITLIQDFVVDTQALSVYAIDKRGNLLYAHDGSTIDSLYRLSEDPDNSGLEKEKTVLYRGTLGENDTVYITDIASGRLLQFEKAHHYRMDTVLTGSQMWNVSYLERDNGENQVIYVSGGQVYTADTEGRIIQKAGQFKKSAGYAARELLYDLLLLAGVLSGVYLLMRGTAVVFTISYSNTQKLGALMILVVMAVSIILVYGLLGEFKSIYQDELMTKLSMTAQIISSRMEEAELEAIKAPQSYMGADYRRLWNKMSTILDKKYAYSDDIYCNILRYDKKGGYAAAYLDNSIGTYYPLMADETLEIKKVYETGESLQSDTQSETGSYIYVLTPIFNQENRVIGVVSVGTMSSVIEGKIKRMTTSIAIAMIMMILTIMFLFGEALSFFDLKDKYHRAVLNRSGVIPMHIVRGAVFMTFMGFNMATSFLPVYIIKFVHADLTIPVTLAKSLPITLNLVFAGFTSVLCPKVIARFGFSKLAVISSGIALCGDLLLATGSHYDMIVAGLILNGIGVGFITNPLHIFMASISTEKENQNGFSIFNASSLSGINCGMLLGSALAERMGQNQVFFVSACVWAAMAMVFLFAGKHFVMRRSLSVEEGRKRSIRQFIASPGILKFIVCIQIPYIVLNSFTYYYVPIFGNEQGYSENITSLLIIICSLCSVYLSVTVTNYLSKRYQDHAMYLSSIITFAGLLIFAWNMMLPSLIAALILIGIANSFGSSTRISYFIRMKESERFGEENAMSIYDLVDNIGESAGSILFAGIISVGFRTGIVGLIGTVAGLNAVYAITKKKKRTDDSSGGLL